MLYVMLSSWLWVFLFYSGTSELIPVSMRLEDVLQRGTGGVILLCQLRVSLGLQRFVNKTQTKSQLFA